MTRLRRILGALIFLPNIMPLKALFSAEIFPWAFFVSTYGIDFEFLKFDKDSSKWCF